MRRTPFLLIGLLALIAPQIVAAAGSYSFINGVVNAIGGRLLPAPPISTFCDVGGGACGFIGIAEVFYIKLQPLIYATGAIILTIFGFRMIVAQEDDIRDRARPIVTSVISGMVLSMLIIPFIRAFYGSTGEISRGGMSLGVNIINTEVTGVINWALVLAAPLAITMIIFTASQALFNPTNEEGIANMRKTIFSVIAGIVLILVRFVLADTFGGDGTPSPVPILQTVVNILNFILTFTALVAVFIIIYAGVLMVLNLGDEERITKAKGLILRAILGLVVIMVSWAIVNFVIGAAA